MVSPDRASALHKSSFRHEAIKHATFEGDNPTLAALASLNSFHCYNNYNSNILSSSYITHYNSNIIHEHEPPTGAHPFLQALDLMAIHAPYQGLVELGSSPFAAAPPARPIERR